MNLVRFYAMSTILGGLTSDPPPGWPADPPSNCPPFFFSSCFHAWICCTCRVFRCQQKHWGCHARLVRADHSCPSFLLYCCRLRISVSCMLFFVSFSFVTLSDIWQKGDKVAGKTKRQLEKRMLSGGLSLYPFSVFDILHIVESLYILILYIFYHILTAGILTDKWLASEGTQVYLGNHPFSCPDMTFMVDWAFNNQWSVSTHPFSFIFSKWPFYFHLVLKEA